MSKSYEIARAIQKKRAKEPKVNCRVQGCAAMIPASNKSGLCMSHWTNRFKCKTSGYYKGD